MAVITQNQTIAKRQKKPHIKPVNKSASFNSGFMSHFDQNPVSHKKKKKAPLHSQPQKIKKKGRTFSFSRLLKVKKRKAPLVSWSLKLRKFKKNREEKPSSGGFSFPIPSLATLAVIAGTVVIALTALNWEDISITFPSSYVLNPITDDEAAERIVQYAATGIPTLMMSSINIENAPNDFEENILPEDDNPHGSLIIFEWQEYRVQRGDSISAIAQRFDVSMGAIIASNNISNARRLQEGAILKIPNVDGIPYQIQRGDSLSRIAASFNVPLDVILDINDIKNDNIRPGETIFIPGARMNDIDLRLSLGDLFMWPLASRHITSYYGMRRDPITSVMSFHTGIDLRANTGTTVMAALDGVVSVVAENWLYGRYIIITHDNGYKTLYGHLSVFSVRQGDRVARGRKIGESGNTGRSTGPHLHFSIYDRNNRLVNPLDLLN